MATRQASKSQKLSSRVANSPTSSTASSSKQFPEHSIDGVSSPASSSVRSKPQQLYYSESVSAAETERPKENVTVTVRFRPLSPREIRQGEEISWYADGETIVRNEHNLPLAYAYDRVFGPTTTTRHVYDVAAQHVVGGAMEGINGTIFAYGVTSSGKTHTMHGDQRSPGIIPLAVKDAFSIIQETPSREFLLRVSYLEIYNEVVNDLLNPAGQNLRIREDTQGTFVEGIKEEVVLSPAHALSLIAAGEEHRHVGSTNFNLLSSRSHTIFTLTIESSPCGEYSEGGAVTLSQLHLIDLAGSESSKAETTGMRRKEGSYINKSLLTLGTVISKLTDGKATHIPYRDSKLTRLLQSSLSGLGRVSLICTVTPSSSNSEETHNTLKFAHRAKHIEIQAAQNKIIDEKSLIKKYQNEIRRLKEELEQLKRGIVTVPQMKDSGEDLLLLKQKLEDGQVRLQSRLEQEEEAKAALLGRIQRLTKLILVSTKTSQSTRFPHRAGPRRRHSFGEEELAYLPHRRRDLILEDENIDLYVSVDGNADTSDDTFKEEKKTRKNGLLNWFKPRRRDSGSGTLASTSDRSSGLKSTSTPSTPQAENHMESRNSHSIPTESMPSAEFLSDVRLDKEVPEDNLLDQENPLTSMKTIDQIDLLREQQKILSGEVALHTSALKRLSEEATHSPKKEQVQMEIRTLKDEIRMKNEQIDSLEKQIAESIISPFEKMENQERTVVKAADNRIIQDQLNQKTHECENLQEAIVSLKQQLSDTPDQRNRSPSVVHSQRLSETKSLLVELRAEKESVALKDAKEALLLQVQAREIEELHKKVAELVEAKEQLELRNQKLAEESTYAKGLASAAAVELKALSEEVAKLMNHNEKLAAELATQKSSSTQRKPSVAMRYGRRDAHPRRNEQNVLSADMKRELALSRERELSYEAALAERDQREAELQSKVEESKQREAYLENELANMWVLVARLKKSQGVESDLPESTISESQRIDGFEVWESLVQSRGRQ
ncbi:kinesin-like protein KIN-7K, chloroplastic isoform X3 [Lycium ferocissimum]|uniref:kinesin-like protein KIN-7K, chloroplastic isoform X3 n=1 Tax=Lycium ferocissimum TaxID=112874 RepID=UPI002815ABB2|nr:kinesin-like protein KIN-7K, chloroplastic isoform X3 [Lycium ferocissimum]